MKKIIIVLSCAMIALSSLSCCGKKTITDKEQVKKTKEDAQKSYDEFEKERDKYKE